MAFDTASPKSIFSSTTFWGSVVSLVATVVPHFYANLVGTASQTAVVATITSAVGFVIAVYGRFTATQTVTLTGSTSSK